MKTLPKPFCCLMVALVSFLVPTARAIQTGSSYDTTPPPDSTAWNYVGAVVGTGASGVYLGDYNGTYWVLTAAHVGLGNFTLNGTTYDAVTGSAIGIYNDDNSPSDLTLYQISADPGLATLALASSHVFDGTTVQMIGFGGGKSWGDNTIADYVADYTIKDHPNHGPGIITLASGEDGNGAQGVSGDSGGGMFYEDHGTWILAGILSAAGDIKDGDTDFGDGTIAVDLSAYRDQILADIQSASVIPEPADIALGFGAAAVVLVLWRRRRTG